MLRLAKSLQFFQQPDDLLTQAQSFIAPQGYSLIVGSNNQNVVPIYGPGSAFQGQVVLQLAKPIKGPCRLRVVFSCRQNLGPHPAAATTHPATPTHNQHHAHEDLTSVVATGVPRSSSPPSPLHHQHQHHHANGQTSPTAAAGSTIVRPFSSSSSTGSRRDSRSLDSTCSASAGEHHEVLFEIEQILLEDQDMAVKRHLFMFSIKLPMCNFPPSFQDRDRSVIYSVQSDLTFMTHPEDPATRVTIQASPVQIKYVPMVPSSMVQFPVIEMGQGLEPNTNKALYKVTVESEQRGASPGESVPFRLTMVNSSPTDLYSFQVALVRTMTFYPEYANRSGATAPSSGTPISQYSPESTIVDSTTIPISLMPNKGQTWAETIHYTIPNDSSLIPTTNKYVTPLFKIDYYIAISLPVYSKSAGLGSWFTQGFKAPPPLDLSQVPASMSPPLSASSTTSTNTTAAATGTTIGGASGGWQEVSLSDNNNNNGNSNSSNNNHQQQHRRSHSDHRLSKLSLQSVTADRVATINTSGKFPTLIQLPLIPFIVGTVPSVITERQLRWPIPGYQDVTAQPCFIRDKFEEEMHRQLERMENLMMEEDDINVEDLVKAAQINKSDSSGSDEDEHQQRESGGVASATGSATSPSSSRTSAQRHADRVPARFRSGMGLKTPPPSPPSSSPPPLDNLVGAMASMRTGTAGSGGGSSGGHGTSQTLPRSAGRPQRSMSPKAGGGLSKEVLLEMHHKAQQQQYASMQ
ncbi:hypothetical protein DFQ27_004560 [Actinomortierella ambigua]|uniref:Arrestin C-terminal-like domain-containing protein n=1 Tax=Actinomortierella ambigua TaxID=1343610 RepID=A0A9P6QHQ3_9FUNG|nr:hypothetical protein DFQ27_004560 [Actinomortierella ambigua]